MKREIPIPQLTAWLIVAVSAPILSFANETGWLSVACAAGICIIINSCRCCIGTQAPRWVGFIEIVAIVLYLGATAHASVSCWQDGIETTVLPIVLLLAAAFSVRNGAIHGARTGAALLWFVVPASCVILLAGISEMRMPVCAPVSGSNFWTTVPLFLFSFLGGAKNRENLKSTAVLCLLSVMVTILLNDAQIPTTAENAFYEYSKGITLFAVAERFEAVSACLLTAGWFALFSFLLGTVYEIAEREKFGMGQWVLWGSTIAAVLIMCNMHIPTTVVEILCAISWGFLPLITQFFVGIKKSKKSRKTP